MPNQEKEYLSNEEELEIIDLHNEYSKHLNKTYKNITPEEWVARFSHFIGWGDMRIYHFENKGFQKWIYEVYNLIETTKDLNKLRVKFLSRREIYEINHYKKEF